MYKLLVWIGGGLLVVLIIFFAYQMKNDSPTISTENSSIQTEETAPESFSEQKDETGPVTVTVEPKLNRGDTEWNFEITLQTHSVELDMDILESVVLLDTTGEEVKPVAWDGDPPGGHHRTGILRFAAPDPVPETITLRVKNVADVPVREFVWNAKE